MAASSHRVFQAKSTAGRAVQRASGSFFSHVLTLASGAGVSEAIRIVGTLILARLIAPADFGFLALFVTVASLVSVVGGARYELAIMLPEQDSEAANVAILAALTSVGIALVSAVGVFALRAQLTKFLGDPRIGSWLWSVPVVLLLSAFGEVGRNWFGRTKNFRIVAVGKVSQSVGVLAGQLGLWALGVSGGMALIGGWLIGQGAWAGVMAGCMVAKNGRFICSSARLSQVLALAAKHKAFPIYRTPYSFIANGSSQLIFIILRAFCGLDAIGLYMLANRAVYLPVTLFGSSMGQVFYQKAATDIKSPSLEFFANRLVRTQIALGVPVLIFFAFEAPLLFRMFLGARWQLAGSFAAWLAFAGFLYLMDTWLIRLFDVCGRQRLALVLQIAGGGASLAALTLVLRLGRSPVWGIGAFTISEVASSIVWLVCAYQISGFHVRSLARLGMNFVVSAAPLAVLGFLIHRALSGWAACGVMLLVTLLAMAVLWRVYGQRRFASARTIEKFRRYWSDKPSPLHRSNSPEFYRAYAAEIRNLFPAREPVRVLEIGCGDGSAFPYLNLPVDSYKGVDFSQHFLDKFRACYPRVDLECAEGSAYVETGSQFDVIFSNEVVQHFDARMLDRHLQNARRMMHAESVLILGSVPDGTHRRSFDAGAYSAISQRHARRRLRQLKAAIRRAVGMDYGGFWYTRDEIVAVAKRHGFRLSIARSELQPYRFHAVLLPEVSGVPDLTERASANRLSQPTLSGRQIDHRLPA